MAGRLARTLIGDLDERSDGPVRVCGWVERIEAGPDASRVLLRDHTGLVALVGSPASSTDDGLRREAAVEAVGTVEADPTGGVRLAVERLEVAGPVVGELPLDAASPAPRRLDWRYLDLRSARNRLIFAVQTTAERAMRGFWADRGFLELHSPKLRATPNRSEGALFTVGYFDRDAYLVQSPQFYKQMAMAAGFDRVFEIGPVFRAQAEPTSRHDTEFTSVDVEISWIDSEQDLLTHLEGLLQAVLAAVRDHHAEDIRRHFDTTVRVPSTPFPRVTLEEARRIVASRGGVVPGPDEDLDPEGEGLLAEHIAAERDHAFVFVTDYPTPTRPFYHMRRADDPAISRSFDLLYDGLEITSGAQREHRYERLVGQARERGAPLHLVRGYLDFFRYGCPPHGGFGLGLTRLLVAMLGLDDVREATFLFRGPDRLTP